MNKSMSLLTWVVDHETDVGIRELMFQWVLSVTFR